MCDTSELDNRYNYLYYNNTQIMLTDYTIYFCFLWVSKFSIFHFIPGEKKDLFPQTFSISQHLPSLHSIHSAKLIPEISVGIP